MTRKTIRRRVLMGIDTGTAIGVAGCTGGSGNDRSGDNGSGGEETSGGEEIYRDSTNLVALRKRVRMVFQQPNPFPKSIRDNVAYGPRKHGDLKTGLLSRLVGRDASEKKTNWSSARSARRRSKTR